jgi:hypothetical protein
VAVPNLHMHTFRGLQYKDNPSVRQIFRLAFGLLMARLWAERTPERFLFKIKPFALMMQHTAEISRLPKQLRDMVPVVERNNRELT